MKEYKVGEIVTVGRVKTRVTKSNGSCEGCIGQKIEGDRLCHTCECRNSYRVDKNDIIFKPIDSTPTPKDVNGALDESKHSEFPLPPKSMRVWIRGNRDRGEEVIKILADLGAKDTKWPDGKDPNVLYYIDTDRIISSTKDSYLLAYFLMNNFKEIKLPYKPKDKELVWAWDDEYPFLRCLSFYDAQNNFLFCAGNGSRTGVVYNHYAPYEGEWPEWAKEALKKLED